MNKKIIVVTFVAVMFLIPFTGFAVAQTESSAGSTATPTEPPTEGNESGIELTPSDYQTVTATPTVTRTQAPTPTQQRNPSTPTETDRNTPTEQSEAVTDTNENATEPENFIGCISGRCVLKVIDYNINSNGRATIELYATVNQRVTLTEMHMGDGFQQLNQKKNVPIPEGRVTMQLWVNDEFSTMGFTVANPHGISGFKDSSGGFSFDETYSGNQMFFFGIFGFVGGVGIVSVAAYKRKMKLNSNVEREL